MVLPGSNLCDREHFRCNRDRRYPLSRRPVGRDSVSYGAAFIRQSVVPLKLEPRNALCEPFLLARFTAGQVNSSRTSRRTNCDFTFLQRDGATRYLLLWGDWRRLRIRKGSVKPGCHRSFIWFSLTPIPSSVLDGPRFARPTNPFHKRCPRAPESFG